MGVKKKVVLLGDSAVGKTSLIKRFVLDVFEDTYIATIGSKVTRKELTIERPEKTVDLTFMIWDVLGREGYTASHARTFAGVHGALLVADLTRRETLESLERYWIPALFKVVDNVPLVFAANKSDLDGRYEFMPTELSLLAAKHNIGLDSALPPGRRSSYATSAKTGLEVEESFESLAHLLLSGQNPGDPVRELYQSLVALGISRSTDKSTPVGVLDAVIVDFCESSEDEIEDERVTMVVLRQEVVRAGIDVRDPTKEGILRLVDYLAEVERDFRPPESVAVNRDRRLAWARGIGSSS